MEHLAIDLGGKESQICVRSSDGQIVEERRCRTARCRRIWRPVPGAASWSRPAAKRLGLRMPRCRLGHEVRVVPATLVRSLGVGARRLKTDRRDAQVLSEVSCRIDLPSVHVPSRAGAAAQDDVRDAGSPGGRQDQVGEHGARVAAGRGPTPAQRRDRHLRRPRPRALRRHDAARVRGATAADDLESLNQEIADADRELAAAAKADPIARRLMTVPGVGPSTSVRFVAALDEISRFSGAHAVESYLGLVPGEDRAPSGSAGRASPKPDRPALRWCLVQAAWAARRARRSRSDAALGRRDREATRQTGRRPRTRAQAGGHPVRDLAGRDRVRAAPVRRGLIASHRRRDVWATAVQ